MKCKFVFFIFCFFCFAQNMAAQGSLSSGLVLYLPFNGNTLDMSGNSNHATNFGATLTSDASGRANCAYSFNGSSNYMEIANSVSLQVDTNLSLCVKVKVQGFYRGICFGNSLIAKGKNDFISGNYGLRFSSPSAGCSRFDTGTQDYTGFCGGSYPFGIADTKPYIISNNWDCVVFTFNGDTAKAYVNGVLRYKFKGGASIGKNIEDVFLGRMNNTTYPYWFKGEMDEVRIYKRALSSSEVLDYCDFVAPTNIINANFKDSATSCFAIQFTDLSTITSTPIKLWLWDFGDGGKSNLKNPSHTYSSVGTYNVKLIVVDSNGFSDTTVKSIKVGRFYRFADAGNDTSVCKISSGLSLNLNAVGGLYYNWTPTIGLSNPSISNPIATILAPVTYVVSVTDSQGCVDEDTINISVDENFADAGNDTNLCFKDGIATIALNGSGGVSYKWTPTAGLSNAFISNPLATLTSPTSYVLAVTSSRGCIDYDTINLNSNKFAIVARDTVICLDKGVGKLKLTASGGVSYKWSPGIYLDNPYVANPAATINSTTTFSVIVTDASGCEDYQTVKVGLDTTKVEVVTKSITACVGQSIQLHATGAMKYQWEPITGITNPTDSITTLVYDGISKYYVKGTSFYGCLSIDSLEIIKRENIITLSPSTIAGCGNEEEQLLATGASDYEWFPKRGLNNYNINNPVITISETMEYLVVGRDANGCVDSAYLNVSKHPVPLVKIQENTDKISCLNTQTTLRASGAVTYLWSPEIYCETVASPATVVWPERTTLFSIVGTDSNGCKGTDTILVIFDGNTVVKIPSAFTPNDDGINDRIKPLVICDFMITEFSVYNRWGMMVYTSSDANRGWDGYNNGVKCDLGTYYYMLKGKNSKDQDVLLKGDITLIR
jgi:gliding motility-associated-like protein